MFGGTDNTGEHKTLCGGQSRSQSRRSLDQRSFLQACAERLWGRARTAARNTEKTVVLREYEPKQEERSLFSLIQFIILFEVALAS